MPQRLSFSPLRMSPLFLALHSHIGIQSSLFAHGRETKPPDPQPRWPRPQTIEALDGVGHHLQALSVIASQPLADRQLLIDVTLPNSQVRLTQVYSVHKHSI